MTMAVCVGRGIDQKDNSSWHNTIAIVSEYKMAINKITIFYSSLHSNPQDHFFCSTQFQAYVWNNNVISNWYIQELFGRVVGEGTWNTSCSTDMLSMHAIVTGTTQYHKHRVTFIILIPFKRLQKSTEIISSQKQTIHFMQRIPQWILQISLTN